ncbi:MAG: tetratricopeptide repeat protein [Pseudomonadota bacterium]
MKSVIIILAMSVCLPTFAAKKSKINRHKDLKVLDGIQKKGPDEKLIYASLIKAYRKDDMKQTQSQLDQLVSYYPRSVYADNAYYLTGILQLKKGYLGQSIQTFDRVIKEYPRGNKRASAMYAKGIAYKKLRLVKPAKKHLNDVIKSYPGSLESQRAKVELRLIKKMKKAKSASL